MKEMEINLTKENGYIMTVHILTTDNNDSTYKSVITNDSNEILGEFIHTDLRARLHWIDAYFTEIKKFKKHFD